MALLGRVCSLNETVFSAVRVASNSVWRAYNDEEFFEIFSRNDDSLPSSTGHVPLNYSSTFLPASAFPPTRRNTNNCYSTHGR